MNIISVLKSPHQRRLFFILSFSILFVCFALSIVIAYAFNNSIFWNVFNNFFISTFASAAFSIFSLLYMSYFFRDPNEIATSTLILPEDILTTLRNVAYGATNYKIFVRTGRHFRSDILPILLNSAKQRKQRINIDVVLLDFRDCTVCARYADFRKSCSFDKKLWSLQYTQSEILATIFHLYRIAKENTAMIEINISLSSRLSMFRIEGSSEQLIITREDPRDTAALYRRGHPDFGSYMTEFNWIQDSSKSLPALSTFQDDDLLFGFFDNVADINTLRTKIELIDTQKSPYEK